MREWKRWMPPAVAAVCLLLGLLALDWIVVDGGFGSLHLTPRSSQLCLGGACVDIRTTARAWSFLSTFALGLGVLAAAGLILVAALRLLGSEPGPFGKVAAGLCAATATFTLLALIAVAPDSFGDYAAGGPLTLVAAVVGLGARTGAADAGAFGGGRSARPIRSTAAVRPATAAPAATPSSSTGPTQPRAPAAANASRDAVRFVIASGTIGATGLTLRFERGDDRTIAWTDIVEVVARRLPPDPPHDKATFVDLVLGDGRPARLTAAARIDYAGLSGGMAANTRENWRRLVAVARQHNPAIVIEADSADFFAGARDAPMFPAPKKFFEWDRRYDG